MFAYRNFIGNCISQSVVKVVKNVDIWEITSAIIYNVQHVPYYNMCQKIEIKIIIPRTHLITWCSIHWTCIINHIQNISVKWHKVWAFWSEMIIGLLEANILYDKIQVFIGWKDFFNWPPFLINKDCFP